ncbi:MAG: hypothetical protein FE048_03550 [Thermoplasmata archaeon]|nr:MAG: hypothetical protein FE048_03550 [Thermoplasmata archaeon]
MNKKLMSILIISFIIAGISSAIYTTPASIKSKNVDLKESSNNVLIRINVSKKILLPEKAEVVGQKPGKWIDIIIPASELQTLSAMGIDYSIIVWNLERYSRQFAGQYPTLEEMELELKEIAQNHPEITQLYSIGKSHMNRDIWCMEISDNPGLEEGEPGVFYMGLHHAREWPSLAICLYIIKQLTSRYGLDPEITNAINNRRVWVVPCVNPDGYYYCHDQGNDWRKNMRDNNENGKFDFLVDGVDLNRNYGGSCNGDPWGAWGSLGNASVGHGQGSSVYCGPWAFSEPETQAIRNLFIENNICASITWHTFGELVLWPWCYRENTTTPDDEYLSNIGKEIALRIGTQDGEGTYEPMQATELYPVTGDTTDWVYGYAHYIQGKPLFAYTIEACSEFQPSEEDLTQICQENFDGAFYLLQEAENIERNVKPRVIPPIIDDIKYEGLGKYIISWKQKNPDANPEHYQIDELTGLALQIDGAESGSKLWNLDGFSITDSKSNSGDFCFKSRNRKNDVSSMTTKYPVPVSKGMNLSFYCSYDMYTASPFFYDCALVEVSTNGRYYEILDKFTGSSRGWEYKEYSLDKYTGESIFIRFRYTTTYFTAEESIFFIDDISPIPNFSSVKILSSNIKNTSYTIENKTSGIYYYRVRGYNEHGWGDYSTLKKLCIDVEKNNPPEKPTISGPTVGEAYKDYEYSIKSVDPDNDKIYYLLDWGDGNVSNWIGPYNSNETFRVRHQWVERGNYEIRAKAMDEHLLQSNWSDPIKIDLTGPDVEIGEIKVIFGAKAEIKNTGEETAYEIPWKIKITRVPLIMGSPGLIAFKKGIIDAIEPQSKVYIKTGMILFKPGIWEITINVGQEKIKKLYLVIGPFSFEL